MTVAFIGDSYTEGWFASAPERGWAELVAVEQGWRGVNLGQAGTGYTATPRAGACGARPCRTYPDMVPVAARARPSALVIAGGVNDFATFRDRPADEIAAIRTTFTKARQALPRAIILGVGPVTPYGVDPRVRAFAAAVREAVEGVGGRYVSMIDPDVLKGGDRSLIVSDGLHPNDAGHAAIAARFTEQVRPDGTLRR